MQNARWWWAAAPFFTALVNVVGCAKTPTNPVVVGESHGSPVDHSTTPNLAAAPPGPSANVVRPGADVWEAAPCRDLFSRYRKALAAGKGTCTTDADCVRYGGVDPNNVCGGVTDGATARSLDKIAAEAAAAACPKPGYSCPAMVPRCLARMCTDR